MESLRDLFLTLGLDADEAAFASAQSAVDALEKAAQLAVDAFKALGDYFVSAVKETAEYGSAIHDTAMKIGVGTDTLQELGYAAQLSGSSLEALTHGLGVLSRTMGAAKDGSKEAQQAFAALGIKVTDSSGHLRAADEVFAEAADALLKLPEGTERNVKGFALFSKGAQELMPLLGEGSKGIAALRQEFRDLGIEMSTESINAAERFGDSLDALNGIFKSIKREIGSGLIEELQPLIDDFVAWWKVNQQIIRQGIDRFVNNLRVAIRTAADAVKWLVAHAKDLLLVLQLAAVAIGSYLVASLLLSAGAAITAAGGMGALIASYVAAGAAAIASGLAAAGAWIAAAAPVIALAAALFLAYLVFDDIVGALNGADSVIGELGPKWDRFLSDWVKPHAGDNWLMADLRLIVSWLQDIEGKLIPGVKKAWDAYFAGGGPAGVAIRMAARLASDAPADQKPTLIETLTGMSPEATGRQIQRSQASNVTTNLNGDINITTQPGQSPQEIAKHTTNALDDYLSSQLSSMVPAPR